MNPNLFKRTYYFLQAKKFAWLAVMLATTAATLTQTAFAPATLLGIGAGLGIFHILPFVSKNVSPLVLLSTILISMINPISTVFNATFYGFLAWRLFDVHVLNPKFIKAFNKTHKLGTKRGENKDLTLLKKLAHKAGITLHKKEVCEVNCKEIPPNAAASGGYENSIYIFNSLFKSPFRSKERKAIYGHELGHIVNKDSYVHALTDFLWWTSSIVALFSFNIFAAMGIIFMNHFAYFGISQQCELLADQFSAHFTNPHDLCKGFDKLKIQSKRVKEHEKKQNQHNFGYQPKMLLNKFKYNLKKQFGLFSHPSTKVRQSYLESYQTEKRAYRKHAPAT